MLLRSRISILCFLLFSFCLSIFIATTGQQRRSHIKTIVTETQHQLNNLKQNFHDSMNELKVKSEYLVSLNISADEKNLWPASPWYVCGNSSDPVIVSAVESGRAGEAGHFLRNSALFLPNHTLILFDLGLGSSERELVQRYCNRSGCAIVDFDFSQFPSHVANLKNRAYRPILIQSVLRDAGAVLWLDIDHRFTTEDLTPFTDLTKKKGGVLTWVMEEQIPTTSRTHPKMFTRFGISNLDEYNFQHMVGLNGLIVYNNEKVHKELMVPWTKCALLQDCIEPIGSQASGCRFDKKPQYRYSGCHNYDVSALNVLLGKMFDYNEDGYVATEQFFVKTTENSETTESSVEETNSTVQEEVGKDRIRRKWSLF